MTEREKTAARTKRQARAVSDQIERDDDPMKFPQVPVVGRSSDQSAATLRREIDAWTGSEALAALVRGFGGEIPPLPVGERLEWLGEFSRVWDYRSRAGASSVERNQMVAPSLASEQQELATAATTALGLVEPNHPLYDRYDHVLVNGALVRYSIWRTAYAGLLLRERLSTRTLASLTARRALAESNDPDVDEPTLITRYGLDPAITDESSMMESLLRREFGLGALETVVASTDESGRTQFGVRGTDADGMRFNVVIAPSKADQVRANTGTTMEYWAATVGNVQPGERVLSISSAIYGPFQHAAALRTLALPYGVEVDTVAIDFPSITGRADVPAERRFRPDQYLQETRSTITAYRSLWLAMDGRA